MGDPRPICISILALLSFVPGALALDLASGSFVLAGDAINGAYKSTNNGQSWFLSNVGLGQNAVTGMVQNGSTIFAIAYQGMFRTTDGAATWALIPESEFRSFFGIATSGSNIYAGAFDGLARSTDGGANWSFIEILNLP